MSHRVGVSGAPGNLCGLITICVLIWMINPNLLSAEELNERPEFKSKMWGIASRTARQPFFVPHEDGDHLIVTELKSRDDLLSVFLVSYSESGMIAEYKVADDFLIFGVSDVWDGKFAIVGTENPIPTMATGPIRSWIKVLNAKLEQENTPALQPMPFLSFAIEPRFSHGNPDSPWRLIPGLTSDENSKSETFPMLMAWNIQTDEVKTFPGVPAAYVGGWVGENRIVYSRVEPWRLEDRIGKSQSIILEVLDLQTGAVETVSRIENLSGNLLHLGQFGDAYTVLGSSIGDPMDSDQRARIDFLNWETGDIRSFVPAVDFDATRVGNSFRFVVLIESKRDHEEHSLVVFTGEGEEYKCELADYVTNPWLSPDGRRVLFSHQTWQPFHKDLELGSWRHRLRMWDIASGSLETVHSRGILDDPEILRLDNTRSQPTCSPWSPDSTRIAVLESRWPAIPWHPVRKAIRVIDIGE